MDEQLELGIRNLELGYDPWLRFVTGRYNLC